MNLRITTHTFLLLLIFSEIFSGCAKETTTRVNTTANQSSQTAIASNEATVNDEFDQAADDAITVICNHAASIAGAIVDTSQINLGVIEIDYFGKEADGTKSRTGADSIHIPIIAGHMVPWGTTGNSATITFGTINSPGYEIIYSANSNSIQLRGSATLTNISGGLLQNITTTDSLKEHIRGNVSFTFNDNASVITLYAWHVNQLRSFIINSGNVYAINQGDTVLDNFANVGTWGTTVYGSTFYSVISSNITQNISTASLSYNPISGSESIEGLSEPIISTYGVNSQGSVVTSGTPYGFLATWINNGGQASAVVPYYY